MIRVAPLHCGKTLFSKVKPEALLFCDTRLTLHGLTDASSFDAH